MLCMNMIALAGSNAMLLWFVWRAPTLIWARNALECMGSGGTYCTHTPAACYRGYVLHPHTRCLLEGSGGTYCTHTPAACYRGQAVRTTPTHPLLATGVRGYVLHPHTRCLLQGVRTAHTHPLLATGGTYCTHTPAACYRGYVLHPHTRCLLEGSGGTYCTHTPAACYGGYVPVSYTHLTLPTNHRV